jgi:hypothetical protein
VAARLTAQRQKLATAAQAERPVEVVEVAVLA